MRELLGVGAALEQASEMAGAIALDSMVRRPQLGLSVTFAFHARLRLSTQAV
jgi:hypothetical protein